MKPIDQFQENWNFYYLGSSYPEHNTSLDLFKPAFVSTVFCNFQRVDPGRVEVFILLVMIFIFTFYWGLVDQ